MILQIFHLMLLIYFLWPPTLEAPIIIIGMYYLIETLYEDDKYDCNPTIEKG